MKLTLEDFRKIVRNREVILKEKWRRNLEEITEKYKNNFEEILRMKCEHKY